MKSIHWGNPGNQNLKGKKTKNLMAGKYVEGTIENFKERELLREIHRELGYSRVSSNKGKY